MPSQQQTETSKVHEHSNEPTELTTPAASSPTNTAQSPSANSSLPLPKPPINPGNTVPAKTLWMGDIEAWWDEGYLVQLWAKLGLAVMVKVIKPKRNLILRQLAKSNGQPMLNHSGYCFVEFDTPQQAQEALALNGSPIPDSGNKLFRLNWATAATLNSQIEQTPEYSLFVGDLSPVTTEAHLLSLFQTHFNTVKTVRVMTDPATGLSRCFGFVRFSSEVDRNRALGEMNGKWLGGRLIRVALATPKHQASLGYSGNEAPGGSPLTVGAIGPMGSMGPMGPMGPVGPVGPMGSIGSMTDVEPRDIYMSAPMGYYAATTPQRFGASASPTTAQSSSSTGINSITGASSQPGYADPTNTTVFVGGLAASVSEDTLRTLFEPFGPIVHVRVPPGKGCGFVKFEDRGSAQQAVAGMEGFVIGGSRIRLSWGRSSNRNRQHQQQQLEQQQFQPAFQFQRLQAEPPQGQSQQVQQAQARQMMMAAMTGPPSGGASLAPGRFDFSGPIPPRMAAPSTNGGPDQPTVFTAPQGGPLGPSAGLVEIPPGTQLFYDPYFASNGAPLEPQESGFTTTSLATRQESTVTTSNDAPNSQIAPTELALNGAVAGMTLEDMPQQFYDQSGQYLYMAPPFPNPMMPLMTGKNEIEETRSGAERPGNTLHQNGNHGGPDSKSDR
ncbi:hypothetical protein FOA43_003080 [Brettanomyces nanus]|uniref:RRM domain-containing protein n=1 Tax=Eeniella nana TaxID=13502 RepID=A0A875S1W6_EENNA|nr:uncharacterized protein FOA43_003080 [Brettanomyces nanus]QPG75721.1 hypothetical protein FOA43_003080 [Brettanomyces nanus]